MARPLFLLFALALALTAKRPITHEDVWLMKRVAAPVASPDGRWVIFNVTDPAYEAKDQTSDLWIVPADGGAAPRQLTFSKSGESDPAWTADSKRVAFAAKRDGDDEAQIYVLDIAGGGEARRLTNLATGAGAPQWSPDGRLLAFESQVYPNAFSEADNKKIAAEHKARKYSARVYDGFPIRHWDHWLDGKRPTLMVMPAEGGAPRDLLSATQLARQAGFAGVNGLASQSLHSTWTPDGQALVFAASVNQHVAAHAPVNTNLYRVDAAGGEPKPLTTGVTVSFTKPQFRPDGKALYALEASEDRPYSLSRIVMWNWPANTAAAPQRVAPAFDRSIDTFAFTPDSAHLYAIAEESGDTKLWRANTSGGNFTAYSSGGGTFSSLTMAAAQPVALWDSAVNPAEVVRLTATGKESLTRFNAARIEQIDWRPVEHFTFTSKRGRRIHNMIVTPPGFDPAKKYPLVALIHGGPHSMWKDQFFLRWNYHLLAAPGYVLLLTDYTGSTGYGEEFARAIERDPLKTPGDEINQAVDEAIAKYSFVDAARLAAGGASYGGHLANWLEATTTRYKCLIAHAGLINLESQWGTSDTIYHREVNNGGPVWEQGATWREQNPIRYAAKFQTPMMLTVGERDFRVPLNQTLENWSVLQRRQIPSRLIVFPEANHWVQRGEDSRFFYQEVAAWFKRWL